MRLTPLFILFLASPLVAQTDSAAIPVLGARVTRMRFFEGGTTLPPMLERRYAERFDSATTRSIYVEIGLAYPAAPAPVSVRVECGYFAPGGQLAGTAVVPVQADQGWELSIHAGGAGSDTPGGWQTGTYAVACRFAGKVITAGSFEVARPATAAVPPPVKPAPKPPAQPAGKAPVPFGQLKARVAAVRLFESGGEVLDRKNRVVTTSFDALTTRFINLELELVYPASRRRQQFEVPCQIEGPDSSARIPVVRVEVDAGWVGSIHSTAWGARNRGMWPEGDYRVTCREQGQPVATTEFKVVKTPSAVAALGASLTHIRFFQSLADRLPVESRLSGTRFDGRTVRWIKTEFGLVYPPVPAPATFSVECVYTFPEGTMRPVTVERRVPAGWTGSVHAQGVGFEQPGHWPAGNYKVSCRSEGREFAAGGFEVFDAGAAPPPASGSTLRFFGRKAGAAGPPAYGQAFEAGAVDTLYAEATVPSRAAGDSTAFRCAVTDPAGLTSGFSLNGEVRDRALVGIGPIGALDAPRMRGLYRVECRAGTRALAADRFEVTGAAELPSLDARLVASALYEGADAAPDDEAVPDVTFSAAKVRSLWLVAVLDHPSDTGAGTFTYSCRITNARNAVVSDTGPQQVTVAAGDRAIVLRQRFAPQPRQRWTAGRYAATCAAGGSAFFKTSLELGR
jgi:hypothetical protein